MRSMLIPVALSSMLLFIGCEKAKADARDRSERAQAAADEEIAKAQEKADKTSREAQAEADRKVAAAAVDFAKVRENYRHEMQLKIEDMNKAIADLEAKAVKTDDKTSAKIQTALPDIHRQRDDLVLHFTKLGAATDDTWDATRAELDREWKALNEVIDQAD